jgi:two-component system cell cycle response regulator
MSQSLRIAIADDEPDILNHYQKALTRLGHQVVVAASSGRELVAGCRDIRPDLVITDIRMPDMDGIAAAAEIYSDAPVPIILASAHHTEELIGRAEASQVLAYLVKPVRAADLSPAIAIALRRFAQLQAMENLSLTDELTGLHNRRGFLMLAEQQLKLARRQGRKLALLFIDVDGLKRVNDTQGHPAGDQLLKATAEVLRKTFRESDVLARLGGDEYCVLVVEDAGGGVASGIQRLLERLEGYNASKGGQSAALSLSVGPIEVDPGADVRVQEHLAKADALMYKHKQGKRGMQPPHRKFENHPLHTFPMGG